MSRWFLAATTAAAAATGVLIGGCQDRPPSGLDETDVIRAGVPAFSTTSSGETLESGDGLIHACYIPGSGMVYRISADGVEGLKEDCRAKQHIEFSWSPGLALAGQMCPTGEFVVGFDAAGTIVCAVPGGDPPPPTDPPPPPPSPSIITSIAITPDPAFGNDDLVCSVTVSDDGVHEYTFSWYAGFDDVPFLAWTTNDMEDVLTSTERQDFPSSSYRCEVSADGEASWIYEVPWYDEICRTDPSACGLDPADE